MSINVMSQYNNHFPTKPEVNNNKRRHSSEMYIKIEQRFWNYRVHHKRRKVEEKKTFKLFIKGIKRKIYRKSKSRATDVV